MLRVDHAGNVSKRFSSGTFPFSKFGGTCPLWNVHATFDTPGQPRHADDRAARRHALFLDRADGAPAGRAAIRSRSRATRSGSAARSDTPRGWSIRPGSISDNAEAHADRRQLPALRARQLRPARRAAAHAHIDVRREHAAGVAVRVLECAGAVRGQRSEPRRYTPSHQNNFRRSIWSRIALRLSGTTRMELSVHLHSAFSPRVIPANAGIYSHRCRS